MTLSITTCGRTGAEVISQSIDWLIDRKMISNYNIVRYFQPLKYENMLLYSIILNGISLRFGLLVGPNKSFEKR